MRPPLFGEAKVRRADSPAVGVRFLNSAAILIVQKPSITMTCNANESQRDSVTEPRVAPPGATLGYHRSEISTPTGLRPHSRSG